MSKFKCSSLNDDLIKFVLKVEYFQIHAILKIFMKTHKIDSKQFYIKT